MGLRADVPGTYNPDKDKCKCGKQAKHTIEGKVEVLGKLIPVKIRVCDDHKIEIGKHYSLGEK